MKIIRAVFEVLQYYNNFPNCQWTDWPYKQVIWYTVLSYLLDTWSLVLLLVCGISWAVSV